MRTFENPTGEVDQGIGSTLGGAALVILRPWSQHSFKGGRQVGAALVVQPAIADPHPVRSRAEAQPPPLMGPILVRAKCLRVAFAAKPVGNLSHLPGIVFLGGLHAATPEV